MTEAIALRRRASAFDHRAVGPPTSHPKRNTRAGANRTSRERGRFDPGIFVSGSTCQPPFQSHAPNRTSPRGYHRHGGPSHAAGGRDSKSLVRHVAGFPIYCQMSAGDCHRISEIFERHRVMMEDALEYATNTT